MQDVNHRKKSFCGFTTTVFNSDINETGTNFYIKIILTEFFHIKK